RRERSYVARAIVVTFRGVSPIDPAEQAQQPQQNQNSHTHNSPSVARTARRVRSGGGFYHAKNRGPSGFALPRNSGQSALSRCQAAKLPSDPKFREVSHPIIRKNNVAPISDNDRMWRLFPKSWFSPQRPVA